MVEALACAVAVQRDLGQRNADLPVDQRIEFRVGINTGDVLVENGDIRGDGVNIAARIESLAEPGGICISAIVHDQVQGRVNCTFEDLGDKNLKNIARPIRIHRVHLANLSPVSSAGNNQAFRHREDMERLLSG